MPFDGIHTPRFYSREQIAEFDRFGREVADSWQQPRPRGRWRTHDDAGFVTFDRARQPTHDGDSNAFGRYFGQNFRAHDGKVYDSSGGFLLGELVRLDQTTHLPLASVSWGRDVDLRQDVQIGDEATSWTLSWFGANSGLGMSSGITGGKSWVGRGTTEIPSVSVDIGMQTKPLRPWAREISYSIFELENALRLGRPIDQQKYLALQMKHQFDIDAQVYAGDIDTGDAGLVTQPLATPTAPGAGTITNVPAGAGTGNPTGWMNGKTPAEILADFNFALNTTWQASAWAVVPERILLPTAQYGYIATELVSTAGTTSILRYVEENNILSRSGRGQLKVLPLKWCNGAGAGGTIGTAGPGSTDRMVVYTKRQDFIRYPLTPLGRMPIQYDGIWHKIPYYGKLGVMEVIYPEVLAYFDKI